MPAGGASRASRGLAAYLDLGHDDDHGAFEVRGYSDELAAWLADAVGGTEADPQATEMRLRELVPRATEPQGISHPEDVARLRRILNDHGYDAPDALVQWAYAQWSEDLFCAGWLLLAEDDEALFRALMVSLRER